MLWLKPSPPELTVWIAEKMCCAGRLRICTYICMRSPEDVYAAMESTTCCLCAHCPVSCDYMIPQIAGSLLKFAIPQGNYT